ncbi:hypothetical protein GCM10011348_29100 [Marinobacterium nitratireducens]|uniref:Uncharacterized protein n=1 Tax=Marinobacterium nitratireducens TaxID=518897 RepID=A0A918DVC2_9GAMM|nr:hypothetical protein [Marinobacterium nitratireducens]GGO83962.1 hypothetical protein GCM10011348_29100 [Marinobacterium nitratireducens]
MARETRYVFESTLADLVAAGAILTAYIIEDGDGRFHIVCRSTGGVDHRLKLKRGGSRTFKSLDAPAQLLRSMGISRIALHMNEFAPGTAPLLS